MLKAKKKATTPLSRVFSKQVTITSPPPAPRNGFWVKQGVDAPGWWKHYCVYVNRQCCSRSGISCNTGLAVQMQHGTSACFQHSLPSLWKSEKDQELWKTPIYHLCTGPTFHSQKPKAHDIQDLSQNTEKVEGSTLLTGLSGTHTHKLRCQQPVLSFFINVSGTQSLRGLSFCLVQKHPSHLNFHVCVF